MTNERNREGLTIESKDQIVAKSDAAKHADSKEKA